MKTLRNLFRSFRSKESRNGISAVGSIAIPSVIGSAVTFLSTPLFASFYTPVQFGLTASALALGSIFSVLLSFRFEILVGSHIYRSQSQQLVTFVTFISVTVASIATLILLMSAMLSFALPHIMTSTLIGIIFAGALAISNTNTAELIRDGHYRSAGMIRLIPPIVSAAMMFLALIFARSYLYILVILNALGLYCASAFGYVSTKRSGGAGRFSQLLAIPGQFLSYIVHAIPQGLLNAAGFLNFYLLFVENVFGAKEAGVLFLAFRIGGFPSALLSSTLGNYVNSRLSATTQPKLGRIVLSFTILSFVMYGVLLAGAPLIFSMIGGPEWDGILPIFAALSLLCAAQLSIGPMIPYFLSQGNARRILVWECARIVISIGAASVAWALGASFVTTTWIFCVSQSCAFLGLAVLILASAQGSEDGALHGTASSTVVGSLPGAAATGAKDLRAPRIPTSPALEAPIPQTIYSVLETIRGLFQYAVVDLQEFVSYVPLLRGLLRSHANTTLASSSIIFVHIPRNAGTSVAQALGMRSRPHFTASYYERVLGRAEFEKRLSIAILRDPVARSISAFKFIANSGAADVGLNPYWRARTRGIETFDQYLDWLYRRRRILDRLDYVMRPQVLFVTQGSRIVVSRIFILETDMELVGDILEQHGSARPGRLNSSGDQQYDVTPEQLLKIREIYSDDFDLIESIAFRRSIS